MSWFSSYDELMAWKQHWCSTCTRAATCTYVARARDEMPVPGFGHGPTGSPLTRIYCAMYTEKE